MSNILESAIEKIISEGLAWKKEFFDLMEARGIHITPVHFYSAIPKVSELSDEIWQRVSDLPGIDMRDSFQVSFLKQVCASYSHEYGTFPLHPTPIAHQYHHDQMMFRSVDAEILHCMVRYFKPKKLIEVGSGYSTFISAAASLINTKEGHPADLTAIEPYPNDVLKNGFPGLNSLRTEPVQDIPLSLSESLGKNDILFIDSSHVAKVGSDVLYLFLEVLPRLKEGVVVHVHDIFIPMDYPKDWIVNEHRFWTEQYLLQAFLIHNTAYEVLWGGSYMHLKHSDLLNQYFPRYSSREHWPGSFWIRRR